MIPYHFKDSILRVLIAFTAFVLLLPLMSCVHEWPGQPAARSARLTVRHELPWTLFEYKYPAARADGVSDMAVRYIFEIYPAGTHEVPVSRFTLDRDDMTLADFTTDIDIPAGEYDVYIWSDFIDKESGRSLFYDADTFSAIKVLMPYQGNTTRKDAFQGMFTASVPSSVDAEVPVGFEVTLRRPLTAYAFISVDLREFIENEIRRSGLPVPDDVPQAPAIDFSRYTARIRYPAYLPVVYNIFRNRPADSATGISYEGKIRVIGDNEVLLGFDYFFINGPQSNINVGIDIIDPEGSVVASVSSITIPVERGRATIVRGDFLTSYTHGGIGINPGFDGDYNIEIK